jgi:hypothetical protein
VLEPDESFIKYILLLFNAQGKIIHAVCGQVKLLYMVYVQHTFVTLAVVKQTLGIKQFILHILLTYVVLEHVAEIPLPKAKLQFPDTVLFFLALGLRRKRH